MNYFSYSSLGEKRKRLSYSKQYIFEAYLIQVNKLLKSLETLGIVNE